jgi:hypothetical protein
MTESWEPSSHSRFWPYVSGRTRTQWVIALLVATVMVDLLSVVSTSLEIDLLERAIAGETITDAEADANDVRQGLIALLRTAMFIGTVIVFLLWSQMPLFTFSSPL